MNPHPHTSTLSVIDPRALAIRSVGYCRHPDEVVIEPRITRQMFDGAGRPVVSWDPRLWGTAPQPNLTTVYGLSGQPVLTDSVDAGWQLSVLNHTGLLHSFWDARGNQRRCEYDDQQRSVAVTEQGLGALPCVVDRFTYGGADAVNAERNQCGRLIRHDNPASSQIIKEYGLAGAVLVESSSYLIELELPDWPLDPDARDEWLEDEVFTTRHSFHPTGEVERLTDAMGNVRTFGYDVSGKLSETWSLLAGEGKQPQRLVGDIRYNALDQIESETAGNGVKTQTIYSADDGRLIRLMAALGSQKPLQDLNYAYDPVGNIVELEDKAQSVSHFNNQRINPINRYRYDSLYQLIEASGWEVANPSHGPALPALLPTPLDPNQRRNYTQRFDYDAAGNLITRHHSGAPGFSMFTSARSNRSLGERDDGSLPGEPDIDSGFDAGGNQLELQRGQAMTWDVRNQLSRVTLVKREDGPDDDECYFYDRPGHRLRKVQVSQTHRRALLAEVRYLPGLEIHRQANGEEHHVISVEAGRGGVKTLHWPEGAHVDQLRYSLCEHLRSSTLELDADGGVLTQEHYYAFGGTACWAGKSELVAKYKTIRYSGKEKDPTGIYYYGFRYYAPWLQCWISADPLQTIDGLNFYRALRNSPVSHRDSSGLVSEVTDEGSVDQRSASNSKTEHSMTELPTISVSEVEEASSLPMTEPLLDRIAAYFQEHSIRVANMNKALSHQQLSDTKIKSGRMLLPQAGGEVIEDEFINEYHSSGTWVFQTNYKRTNTKDYFASDVQLVQIAMLGIRDYPTMIVRNEVRNKQALEATQKHVSGTEELKNAFFKTPNGKNTAQILKALKMEAVSVTRVTREGANLPSFYITVRPKTSDKKRGSFAQ